MSPTYGSGIGVYTAQEVGDALEHDQVSSDREGRHLTFLASELSHEHDLVTKGHPVLLGENIVGIAFKTEVNASDPIAIDTEGIWRLLVKAEDELGDVAVVAGDELFLSKTTWRLSKNQNKNTHVRFGYALGGVDSGESAIIAVKVHWNPDDAVEVVGQSGALFTSARANQKFREYYYEATGSGVIEGVREELSINSDNICVTACGHYFELNIPAGPIRPIIGRSSVIEARLNLAAGLTAHSTMGVMCLDFENLGVENSITNWSNSYMFLRDRSPEADSLRYFAVFYDKAALKDGGLLSKHILEDTNTEPTINVMVKCGYGAGPTEFWLLGSTTPPD